jgi:hypothetical protein
MRALRFSTAPIATIAVVSLAVAAVAGQGQRPRSERGGAAAPAFSAKTPWGHPDLQGIWDFRTVTPMERPVELGDKAVLTAKEAEEFEQRAVASRDADQKRSSTVTARRQVNGTTETEDLALAYNDFWWDRGTKVVGTRRTSLIVDPPNGRFPPLTEAGEKRLAAEDAVRERLSEGPEDRPVGERCILGFNSGPPMTPNAYNMNVQLLQTSDYVVLLNEMVHNARIVPLDGRPHGNIRQWVGDSRGRWDGHTLVVETTNFYQNTSLRGSSSNMRLTERFTRVSADMLLYEFTVNDPKTWTKSWTAQIPMMKTDLPMYEYACHEGNYGMTGILSGARALEKAGEGTAPFKSPQ